MNNKLYLYIPYKLKFVEQFVDKAEDIKKSNIVEMTFYNFPNFLNKSYKPILRNIKKLNDFIEHDGVKFIPFIELQKLTCWSQEEMSWLSDAIIDWEDEKDLEDIPYGILIKLLEWNFDVFGFIKKRLAFDLDDIKND